MIVVDVGCYPHGPEESIHKLIDRFHPEILFGFDPFPALVEGVATVDGTVVVLRRAAAWTEAGVLPIRVESHDGVPGIATGVTTFGDPDRIEVEAFDLLGFLVALPAGAVLKLDAEGAELPILRSVAARGIDERLSLVLVEWHPEELAHGMFCEVEDRPRLLCPVEEW